MAVLTRVALCAVALMLTASCRTGQEQWGPFRGQVVDAETGEPIAGAHVMALWIREPPSLHYQQWVYDARETVTDADGRFEIPYARRWLTAWVNPPRIDVFAPGYAPQEPVVEGGEREYIHATVVPMRPLTTTADRCKYRPREPAVSNIRVPRFIDAVQQYNMRLQCIASAMEKS